jgi:quercetin dioxygenase-like cupin family protein
MLNRFLCGLALISLAFVPAQAADMPKSKVSILFDHVIPNVPGKSMRGVLVEYPPGGASAAHTHPHSAFITATVLEGAVTSKVNDGPETAYTAGQSFTEMPGDHHAVSRNASSTEPARLLAVFVVDTDDTKLVTEDAQ